ncbi:DRIM (Down-regulated in metastasis)-like protein [Handroanthus impetiginosus]|uniref:DRIM (Down-regulated in metastasis)-like protein n=1 Tax=Handroanthus impetiginosus TaxID=429701 RepID=A0A2G9HWV7_9LAMI|nr:DRIM (Down-regulated in metastasis)-like protein [Handroanthus impetiginosus]
MDLINAIDELLIVESKFAGFEQSTWQSLIGASLHSYHKSMFSRNIAHKESILTRFFDLAKRYKLSPQILSSVADILDSISGSLPDTKFQCYHPEHIAGKVLDALEIFAENLYHANKKIRLSTLRILCHYEPIYHDHVKTGVPVENNKVMDVSESSHVDDPQDNVLNLLRSIEETALSIETSRKVVLLISKIQMSLTAHRVADQYIPVALNGIMGIFHNRFSHLWNPAQECLTTLISQYFRIVWDRFVKYLGHCQSVFLASHDHNGGSNNHSNKVTGLVGRFNSDISPLFDTTPCATVLSLLLQSLQKVPSIAESHSRQIIPMFLKFLGYNVEENTSSVASFSLDHKGKEWKGVLKEWLSLFSLLRNPKALHRGQFFRDVLQYRLLDQNDADLQMKVLHCLLNWRDDFLLPYSENLKNLINAKNLREELTRWSLSRNSTNSIDARHRTYVVPVVIRILIPKVRSLKMLASQKNASVHHRRAVLGFLAQLDIDELSLFFWLLIKPLLSIPQGDGETNKTFWCSSQSPKDEFDTSEILKHFTNVTINALSWKKRYSFLHVVEDFLVVFDESHLNPFLDLLMNCVVRFLASCTSSIGSAKSGGLSSVQSSFDTDVADHDGAENQIMERMGVKQFKDLRSLCLKIIYTVLDKYEYRDFGGAFWDLFFESIKPLIANFKQEGASSKKPSSLFNCFLAMSKSDKLVSLLCREGSLVPDIFSMLAVPSASESILSCVLKFIKNLLKLDSELGGDDMSVKRILLPHLDVLLCSLHGIFTNDSATKRRLLKFPGKREFTIFNLLTKYVKEPSAAKTFVDMLLPLLTKGHQNFDTVEVLQILRQVVTVLGTESSKKILSSITPLLISAGLAVRTSICDVLDAVAENDSSVLTLAKILRELNATSEMEMGGLDYDKILCAYDRVNVEFFYSIQEVHVLPILAHSVHDMSSGELILRQCAFRLLLSFIEFSGQILNVSPRSDLMSEASIRNIVSNFYLKHMGNAMDKEAAVKKVWIDLLREMVFKLPTVANLGSYRALCSDDAEQDFFNNIVHLQKHRRARALSRFGNIVSSGNLSEVVTYKVFIPLLFSMLFDVQTGKDEHIRSACVDALASISGLMKWNQYYGLLVRCFRDLTLKPDKQKLLLRLICSILDHFHFSKSLVHEAEVPACDSPDTCTIDTSSLTLRKCSTSAELPAIQMCLHKKLYPRIQKLLTADSENVNVNISLVALKLLKLLPREIMEMQLPSIVHRISNFLKNRLESIRDEARSALAACLKELGLKYLQFIVKVLKGTLKRGYELHVLGYTLNFMLSKFLLNPFGGELDDCLEDLLSVVENDILGDVSEEKEVEKIASKMKETRKQKSYDTLKLIAQSIIFKTHAVELLSPVTIHLNKHLTQKMKLKLENMLNHIASGIECNPSVDQTELFIFVYCLIKDGINDEGVEHEHRYASRARELGKDDEAVQTVHAYRLVNVDRQFYHLITAFALGVLQSYMKNLKLNREDGQQLSLLDPFVSLLGQCLTSKYENIITASLRCLSLLVRLPLPSLQSEADKIKNSLLVIAQGSVNASSQLTESCIKLLTTLLRSTRVTLSADQLHMLIEFPMFVDFANNPSFVALSLLKGIVHRKLVVPEIYDLVKEVAKKMVQSQLEPIRKKCSQIYLQFLLGYHLSGKRLQEHLDFLFVNLRYEHSTGREAVLEMLHAILLKFPRKIVDEQCETMFMYLVDTLANDDDSKVRSMTAAAIKCLVGNVSAHLLNSILEYSLSWYLSGKQKLWGSAAQILGLLVEVMEKRFQNRLTRILPAMRSILQSAVSAFVSSQQNLSDETVVPFWKEAYYSLVLFEKILHQFQNFFDKDLEDIWETICEFLLHPHLWLRNISVRILSLYFVAVTNACRDSREVPMGTFFLMKPSMLFLIAVSLSYQLKVSMTDDAAGIILMQNLVFSICSLQSILENNGCMDVSKFWSSLDRAEQDRFLKAFGILDPRKGRRMLASFTSDASGQQDRHQHPFISYLLQRLGKISFEMEVAQMKIVFNCYKSISLKLLGSYGTITANGNDVHGYAYQLLLPLYRVCEGYTGKVVSDDLKQLAQEVCESIRDIIGVQIFVQIYSQIRKNLKAKRDKRKQGEKIMAVVNPVRNAKRKLRIAAKHRAHKKRKIMTMKMGRWMH